MTYLGSIIDETLSGEEMVNNIVKKSNSRLKFLYRHAISLSKQTRKTLATALIQCHFDYSCSSWYSGLNENLKKKLQIIQNKLTRFILNKGPREHIGQKELSSIGSLKVEDRVKQLKLNHVHKIFNNSAPAYMTHNFDRLSGNHNYSLRNHSLNFFVPSISKQLEKTTFFYTGIIEWNKLPSHIKMIISKPTFKFQVKKYLNEAALIQEDNSFIYH